MGFGVEICTCLFDLFIQCHIFSMIILMCTEGMQIQTKSTQQKLYSVSLETSLAHGQTPPAYCAMHCKNSEEMFLVYLWAYLPGQPSAPAGFTHLGWPSTRLQGC